MRLMHPYDRQYDLAAQMEQLSRDTTEMLLETLCVSVWIASLI